MIKIKTKTTPISILVFTSLWETKTQDETKALKHSFIGANNFELGRSESKTLTQPRSSDSF